MENCPLCYNECYQPEVEGPKSRLFYLCENCCLIFERKENRPSLSEEKERYLEHNNGIEFEGYVNHLNKAIKPALPYLKTGSRGLDYGCGPVPTLNILLEQEGFACEFYDPIFFSEPPVGNFDFIFATECFEHFFKPANEIYKLKELLNPKGILVVMTQMWNSNISFNSWSYAHDPTHVVFYHRNTFSFIAANFDFKILGWHQNQVIILQKI